MSTPQSNNMEYEVRSIEEIVASIIETIREYKRDIQETIQIIGDQDHLGLKRELKTVSISLDKLLESLNQLSENSIKFLRKNLTPDERTLLAESIQKPEMRVVLGDISNTS